MSECVVRMERVPKNCDDGCWGSLSGECPWRDSIDGYKMVGNRPPNCPIIAVLPDGHGDLVEAKEITVNVTIKGKKCSADVYATTIVPADTAERSEYEHKQKKKYTNWIGEEMVEQQIDKDVSRFADGEWWKE